MIDHIRLIQVGECIKHNRVYVESVGKKLGDQMRYDFMICGVDTGEPILRGPFIYDSKEDALYAGQTLALRKQQQGQLEKLTAA